MWKYYLALVLSTAANAFAQVIIKQGVQDVWPQADTFWMRLVIGLRSGLIWLGMVIMSASLLAYMYSLGRIGIAVAAPVATGIGILLITLFSRRLVKGARPISLYQIIGFVVIIAGVWLVVLGKPFEPAIQPE